MNRRAISPIAVAALTLVFASGYALGQRQPPTQTVGQSEQLLRSLDLTNHLIRLADRAGFEVTSQREQARRGASISVRMAGFEGVHKELAERQVLCDFRPEVGLRLGPHFFNTEEELDFAIGQVEDILVSGAHEPHVGAAARF